LSALQLAKVHPCPYLCPTFTRLISIPPLPVRTSAHPSPGSCPFLSRPLSALQ
jgi:hypothetical protein